MRRYDHSELRAFLVALDEHLTRQSRIVVIGGSAATLGFRGDIRTGDVDTFQSMTAELGAAAELARRRTNMDIPLGDSSIADLPYDFEDRLVNVSLGLQRLQIWVPEIHDLVISKSLRGAEHDLQQLRELRDTTAIDRDVLVARFRDEMSHAIGDPRRLKANFIDVVLDLFGETAGLDATDALEGWEKR